MDENAIWMSGVLESLGTFTQHRSKPMLVIKSTLRPQVVRMFAERAGINHHQGQFNGREGTRLTISGRPLHDLMRRLWPYLSKQRQYDYARVKRLCDSSR